MGIKTVKLRIKLFVLIPFLFFSCVSQDKAELFIPVDYTEEDAVNDEIKDVEKLLEKDNVKALWRADIVKRNAPSNAGAGELFLKCTESVFSSYEEALKKEDWISAFRFCKSLESIKSSKLSLTEKSSAVFFKLMRSSVPGLKPEASVQQNLKIPELIKGTVTVFVDKGIKIERGMGYADAVLGSGFFISKDGYIVTNHHVIEDCVNPKHEGYTRLYVKLAEDPDTRIPAEVKGWDSSLDIALIKCAVEAPYVFQLGSSSELDVGTEVYAIGSPLGLEKTLTRGIISSTDRRVFIAAKVFQLDAAVNSGNSGGPLIDSNGRVQAVVFAGVQNYQGLNFAIPVEYLKSELPFLYAGGERIYPWIGGYGRTKRLSGSGAKNEGVSVHYAMPGGVIFRSGIKAGDTIVSVDSKNVSSLDDLQFLFMSYSEKTILRVRIRHEDETEEDVPVYLEKRPEYPGYEVYRHDIAESALLPIFGMSLVHSSTSDRKQYTVTSVIKNSIADETGFAETDPVILYSFETDKEKQYAVIQLQAKRHNRGFLDVPLILTCPLDSPYYF